MCDYVQKITISLRILVQLHTKQQKLYRIQKITIYLWILVQLDTQQQKLYNGAWGRGTLSISTFRLMPFTSI